MQESNGAALEDLYQTQVVYYMADSKRVPIVMPKWIAERHKDIFCAFASPEEEAAAMLGQAHKMLGNFLAKSSNHP